MKRTYFFLPLFLFLLTACDFPSILSGDNRTDKKENSSQTMLSVEITGGLAGVNQKLVVDEFGLTVFEDSFKQGAKWVNRLSSAELDSLTQLMLQNNFFQLNDQYIDGQVADAFYYSIFFTHNNQSKTVRTDYFGAPDNLKRIVDAIVQLKDKITQIGLDLKLELSKERIDSGEGGIERVRAP